MSLIKAKNRVADHGEVFTPAWMVNAMLDFVKDESDDLYQAADIVRYKDSERADHIVQNWLRNRNTIEFLGIWEPLNKPGFNPIELGCTNAGVAFIEKVVRPMEPTSDLFGEVTVDEGDDD